MGGVAVSTVVVTCDVCWRGFTPAGYRYATPAFRWQLRLAFTHTPTTTPPTPHHIPFVIVDWFLVILDFIWFGRYLVVTAHTYYLPTAFPFPELFVTIPSTRSSPLHCDGGSTYLPPTAPPRHAIRRWCLVGFVVVRTHHGTV